MKDHCIFLHMLKQLPVDDIFPCRFTVFFPGEMNRSF